MADTVKKILSFGELKEGWNFGDGKEIDWDMIGKALDVHFYLHHALLLDGAFPMTNGGIILSFYFEDQTFDVRLNPDRTITFIHEIGFGPDYEEAERIENVDLGFVKKTIGRYVTMGICVFWALNKIAHVFRAHIFHYPGHCELAHKRFRVGVWKENGENGWTIVGKFRGRFFGWYGSLWPLRIERGS